MISKYIKGDIVALFLSGKNIAHGCNCFHTMGAGVAGQLAKAYPPISAIDKDTDFADSRKLGTFTKAVLSTKFNKQENICFNLYTQYYTGPDLRYGALVDSLIELNKWAENQICIPQIYMPRIGCGIAGGDWTKVEALINMFTPNIDVVIVDWEAL